MEWQPISTAPTETECLVTGFIHDDPARGRWVVIGQQTKFGHWYEYTPDDGLYPPTHWMPLPPSPDSLRGDEPVTKGE